MAILQVVKGYMDSSAAKKLAPGGDVDWPGVKRATKEQRRNFRAALCTLAIEKGLAPAALSQELFGQYRDRKTKATTVRNASQVYAWLRGESFPSFNTANGLAQFFGKPLQWFLDFDGPQPHIEIKRQGAHSKRNGNGHAGPPVIAAPQKSKPEAPPPRALPKGAKPIGIDFKTHASDPDFAEISITGTASLDLCLGLVAFIERHRSPRE